MSWLRSIQGQLTELASEVLSEATEEVADPESELQVAKKKCTEAEKELTIQTSKAEALERKVQELEQQLYDTHVEMDAIGTKYGHMLEDRDSQIKKLKVQLEQYSSSLNDDDFHEDEIAHLRKEVAHWKALVEHPSASGQAQEQEDTIPVSELEARLEALRLQKDDEIAALLEQQTNMMLSMRESYEERLSSSHEVASTSTNDSNIDAVLVDRADVKKDEEVIEDLHQQISSSQTEIERLKQTIEDLRNAACASTSSNGDSAVTESLRRQNEELTRAYNDLNEELEKTRADTTPADGFNHDLMRRIDALRANLIEYEERYEICKRENLETERQLTLLTSDYDRLKKEIDDSKIKLATDFSCDVTMEEVERMQSALDEARKEANSLRGDVEKFRTVVASFDEKLAALREDNDNLQAQNYELKQKLFAEEEKSSNKENFEDQKSAQDRLIASFREENEALVEKIRVLEEQIALFNRAGELKNEEDGVKENLDGLLAKKVTALEEKVMERTKELIDTTKNSITLTDEINSLTQQLKEALAANSEKTEECEKLRNELEDRTKDILDRQTCIDDLLAQNNLLQVEYQQTAEAALTQREKMKTLESSLETTKMVVETLKEELFSAKLEARNLKTDDTAEGEAQSSFDHSVIDAHIKEASNLRGQIGRLEREVSKLLQQVTERSSTEESDLREQIQNLFSSLRNECLEDMKSAAAAYESVIAGLKEQNGALLAALSSMEELNESQSKTIETLKESSSEADQCVEMLSSQNKQLSEDNNNLRSQLQTAEENAANLQPVQNLTASNSNEIVEKVNSEMSDEISKLRIQLEALEATNESLKQVLSDKHEESVGYYEQLQSTLTQLAELQAKVIQLQSDTAVNEKREKEIARLREHLVLVEDASTRDAIEAERRETELRSKLRELEALAAAANEGASESTLTYQAKIASLSEQLHLSMTECEDWKKKCEVAEGLRRETSDALTSLQGIVRELSNDHEKESALSAVRVAELEDTVQTLQSTVESLRRDVEQLTLDKQAVEDSAEVAQNTLTSKQKIIDELEVQLDELRAKNRNSADTYRIDDETLRQLFMSYLTASPDKKPEIALLLTSILGYSKEDMEKIRVSTSSNKKARPTGSGGSLTEQFIRFLESESESSQTAPHLPVVHERVAIREHVPSPRPSERLEDILK